MHREFISGSGLILGWNPVRGAKIVTLRDARGHEWLTQSETPPATPGTDFISAEMAGWDECTPTITRCEVAGRQLPDHGDAWDAAWEDHGSVVRLQGASWPYRLTRTVTQSDSGGIRLDYEASTTDGAIPFLWAAHPQFAAEPGTRVVLSDPPETMVDVLSDDHRELPWNERLLSIDDLRDGDCRKLYLHPDHRESSASLARADGSQLRLRWSEACAYLGIWLDNAAFAREPVIAIEPSIAFADSLAFAVENGLAPTIQPGAPVRWWLEIDA